MPPSKSTKIYTLQDLAPGPDNETRPQPQPWPGHHHSNHSAPLAAHTSPSSSPTVLPCYHIPTLPHADYAKALLERVVREFEPIAHERGYNIRSVSELCCCHQDGLDFAEMKKKNNNSASSATSSSSSSSSRGAGRRRQKLRKQPDTIWGYNMTTRSAQGRSSHTIHVRLRHARHHDRFHAYEDVAGTLAHELAHCEHGPHNDKFYKLMDDILDQHAMLRLSHATSSGSSSSSLLSGMYLPRSPVPFAGTGRVLGRAPPTAPGAPTKPATVLAQAVRQQPQQQQQQQQQNQDPSKGYQLGGDSCFTQWMTPAEAAVVAAQARRRQQQLLRLRGDRCCRPCIIELHDTDEEEQAGDDRDETVKRQDHSQCGETVWEEPPSRRRDKKRAPPSGEAPMVGQTVAVDDDDDGDDEGNQKPRSKQKTLRPTQSNVVDLTLEEDDDDEAENASVGGYPENRTTSAKPTKDNDLSLMLTWSCSQCTFLNQPLALACSICQCVRCEL